MTDLRQAGYRYIYRSGAFMWSHPSETLATDFDCTAMNDEQFETFVAAVTLK